MSDVAELSELVALWSAEVDDLVELLTALADDEAVWQAPTTLPGWSVHDVVAHLAHLEALLAGADHDEVEIGDAPHARGAMGRFTEQGVVARRGRTPRALVDELSRSAATRRAALAATPPDDGSAPAPGLFGALGWSVRTLLRNRIVDVVMHAQDIRRAAGLPGGLRSAAAMHATEQLLDSLGYVSGKAAALPPGTTVVLEVEGHSPRAVEVDPNGRGQRLAEIPAHPDVHVRITRGAFLDLAGGRDSAATSHAVVTGDEALAVRLLDRLAVTP